MRTIAIVFEYDGTDFLGWQMQATGRTVQSVVEGALRMLLQEDLRVTAAGRTDTGVHAIGQVAHFKTDSVLSCDRIKRGLNGLLPDDVTVHSAQEVSEGFHARFSAVERQYRYRILLRSSALQRRYAWFVAYRLEVAALRLACAPLVGLHDFTSFCQTAASEGGAICEIRRLEWTEEEDELRLDIAANRFLHHMVRTLVGTAIEVGRGRWDAERVHRMLEAKDRRLAGPTAPAHGLCLMRVRYPEEYGIQ